MSHLRRPLRKQLSQLATSIIFISFILLVGINITIAQMTQAATSQSAANESVFNNVGQTLYVDVRNAAASDQNPGTADRPFRTVSRGVSQARTLNGRNIGVRVVIRAGVYRETVSLGGGGTTAPIIFEGVAGQTIISGSDVWTGWAQQSGNIYTHNWPYDWGLAPIPSTWIGAGLNVPVPDIVRRREMIFVNGRGLRQVLSRGALNADTFYVDEGQNLVTINLANATNVNSGLVEVAVRGMFFTISDRQNVAVRGLTIQHGSITFASQAQFTNVQNTVLENNTFALSSDTGLMISRSSNITTRGNTYLNNGATGYVASRVNNYLSENDTSSGNNWRGAQGNFLSWTVAGIKHLYITNSTYRGLNTHHNSAHGIWFDTGNTNVILENIRSTNNLLTGLYMENSVGPITVRNSIIANNTNEGVQNRNIKGVSLLNNIIYGNGTSQIYFTGENAGRMSGNVRLWPAENFTITGNIIIGKDSSQRVVRSTLSSDVWQIFVNSLISNSNTWYNPQTTNPFGIGSGSYVNLSGWKNATHEDSNSVFQNVQFRDPNNNDFTIIGDQAPPPSTNTPSPTVSITSFTLIDATTDQDVRTLVNGDTVNLTALRNGKLNIRANTGTTVGSIRFNLSGTQRTESVAPYTIWGDDMAGDYYDGTLAPGTYTLTATPYSGSSAQGNTGTALTVRFTVVNTNQSGATATNTPRPTTTATSQSYSIVNFILVNADTERDIRPLVNGEQINLALLPTRNLNIRVNTNPVQVGSVRFNLNGSYRTESGAPYALYGNEGQNFYSWTPAAGTYNLSANAYTQPNLLGTAGPTLTIRFTIVNQTSPGAPLARLQATPQPQLLSVMPTSTPSPAYAVTGFMLVNADTLQDIQPLTDGETIDLATLPTQNLNIRVNTNPGTVGSVRIELNGSYRTENLLPYALWGDDMNGYYNPWNPTLGAYMLTATAYASAELGGIASQPLSIRFAIMNSQPTITPLPTSTPNPISSPTSTASPTATVTPVVTSHTVTGFVLVNSDTNQDIHPLVDGETLDLALLPTRNLSVRVNTNPATVGSVRIGLNGVYHAENVSPYSLWGNDTAGNYNDWTPALGIYSLSATTFSSIDMTGTEGGTMTMQFTVIDNSPVRFNLTLNSVGGGSVTTNPNQSQYDARTQVQLVAVPQSGWQFTGWSGSISDQNPTILVTINNNLNITANFSPVVVATSTSVPLTATPLPPPVVLQQLALTSVCAGTWNITNSNATPINYAWEVAGTGIRSPLLIANPASNPLLTGATVGQSETLVIYFDLADGLGERNVTQVSSMTTCP